MLCACWWNAQSAHFLEVRNPRGQPSPPCFGSPCSPTPEGEPRGGAEKACLFSQLDLAVPPFCVGPCSHKEQPAPGGAVGF